jgi:hypothetical protein
MITTIRVVSGTDRFTTKDRVLKSVSISLVRVRRGSELCEITISAKGAELSKLMGSVWPRM